MQSGSIEQANILLCPLKLKRESMPLFRAHTLNANNNNTNRIMTVMAQ
jgi:hypothetical protein